MMRTRGWDAVIISGSDPHQSEYPALRWKQVEWLTGFTGEAGDVVVTLDHAGLWTDTRYFIQAVRQLEGTGVKLHKTRVPEQVLIPQWLSQTFRGEDAVIAVDSLCQSAGAVNALREEFALVAVPDLLGSIWPDRPGIPQTPIFRLRSGEQRAEKIGWLREMAAENGCSAILLSALDEVAWALNVRASDIEYNPLVISTLLIGEDYVKWFVTKEEAEDESTASTFEALSAEGVEILPYSDAALVLGELEDDLEIDTSTLNYELFLSLNCRTVDLPSPVGLRKAAKNDFEVDGMREAHIKDGVAVEKFLYWLEKSLESGRRITEWDASVKLGKFRAASDDYLGDSFETISAYGPGAALPHYITPKTDAPVLEPHGLYLCDSGAHYLCGTTDITRTIPLGNCTPLEVRDYTLVLKGHIDLAMAQFPEGTPGCRIDALSRAPLWNAGLDFGHGTGHGVGFVLGVHEGPQDIRQNMNGTPMMENMITSDEPGIYREGLFGIRHENLLLCVRGDRTGFGRFLKFEPLTLCHFDTSVLDVGLLDRREVEWLNDYNSRVYETLSPMLSEAEALWLSEKCKPIQL